MWASLIVALVSVLVLSHSIELARANILKSSAGDLRSLCKDKEVNLHTLSDLKKLIVNLNDQKYEHECKPHVQEALTELGRVAEDLDACTMEKAQNITQYTDTYLKPALKDDKDEEHKLPKSLVRFALAYGMQVSNICKKHMVYKFAHSVYSTLVEAGDFGEIWHIISKNSPLGRLLKPIVKPGEIVLPSDLEAVLPGLDKKFTMLVGHNSRLERLKELCEKRLQPLYEPILLPIAHLTRAGFNYKDSSFRRDMRFLLMKGRSRLWSRIVFLCETLKPIQIDPKLEPLEIEPVAPSTEVEEAKMTEKQEDETKFGCDSEDEDHEAEDEKEEEEMDKQDTLMLEKSDEQPATRLRELKQFKPYVPNEIIGDKIIGHLDYTLKSLVKSFDANQDETRRLQQRILDRSSIVFKDMFKWGVPKGMRRLIKNTIVKSGDAKELKKAQEGLLGLMDPAHGKNPVYKLAKFVDTSVKSPFITISYFIGLWVVPIMLLGYQARGQDEKYNLLYNKFDAVGE